MKNIPLYILAVIIFVPLAWIVPQAYYDIKVISELDWGINSVSTLSVSEDSEKSEGESELAQSNNGRQGFETIEQIKDYIRLKANFNSVNPELALKIAECESQFRNVCNAEFGCTSGIGIFQILQSTFDETLNRMYGAGYHISIANYIPYDIRQNIRVAIWLMSQDEYWRWNQSKHCWGEITVIYNNSGEANSESYNN